MIRNGTGKTLILGLALATACVLSLPGYPGVRGRLSAAVDQAASDPYVGHFASDGGMTVDIAGDPEHYTGSIHLNKLEMPLVARLVEGHLQGTFSSGGANFPFTAQVEGQTLSLKTGSKTYQLNNAKAASPVPAVPAPPGAGQAPAAAGGQLTIEQIGQALDKFGKNTLTDNGVTSYSLTVARGKWNINVIVGLSPNHSYIWITNQLASLPDVSRASPEALGKLLEKSAEIGPMFFGMVGPRHSLRLSNPVPNHDLTPEALQAQVEALISTVLDTEPLWRSDVLVPAAKPAPGADNPLNQ